MKHQKNTKNEMHDRQSKNPLPTHKVIPKHFGLETDSLVLMEQIRTIDRSRILRYIGRVDEKVQSEIDTALVISLGLLLL